MGQQTDSAATESDDDRYRRHGLELCAAVDESIVAWLSAVVAERFPGEQTPPGIDQAIENVRLDAADRLQQLAAADVDEALSGPLERIRGAVESLAPVLEAHGVTPPPRDAFEQARRPDDVYLLGPQTFLDLGPRVHEAGIAWGAAKAYLHRARRREENP